MDANGVGHPDLGDAVAEVGVVAIARVGQHAGGIDPGGDGVAQLVQSVCGLVWKTISSGMPACARRAGSSHHSCGRYRRYAIGRLA